MKIKIGKIKNILKKSPRGLALHPFLAFWVLLFIALILGGFIFYRYSVLAEKPEGISREILRFQQETHQKVLNQWQRRKENLENIDSRQYINPFQEGASLSVPPEEATSTPEELPPEEVVPSPEIKKLLAARNLFEFYWLKGEKLPSIYQREITWNGWKLDGEYIGTKYQNLLLLEKLKEELTE